MSALPFRSLLPMSLLALLSACSATKPAPFHHDEFNPSETYSRVVPSTPAQACEAARRALLSQGYVVVTANADAVNARKSFQPEAEMHVEIDFRTTCAPDVTASGKTLVFVSALQDRYALKKSNNSASLGVGVLGSVSLPFSSSDDALVKVASETITASTFYDRYFKLLTRYLSAGPTEVIADKP